MTTNARALINLMEREIKRQRKGILDPLSVNKALLETVEKLRGKQAENNSQKPVDEKVSPCMSRDHNKKAATWERRTPYAA